MTFGKKKGDYISSYCLVVIPRILFVSFFVYPMNVTGDELFLFYLPAKLAGLDWDSCMQAYRYYGYGFSVFLTPLFRLIDNPILLYRIVLVLVTLIEGIIPIICCILLKKNMGLNDKKKIIPIAVICSYAVNVTVGYMYNEHIYTVCVWGCFFWVALLLKCAEDKKKKVIYSILLGLNMILALTVHQRAVTLLIGFVFLYLCMFLLYRKKVGYIWLTVPVYLLGAGIDRLLMSKIITLLKGMGQVASMSTVQNTGVDFTISKAVFTDMEYIHALVRIGIGQINVWNFATAGLGIFSLVLIFFLSFQRIRGKVQKDDIWVCLFGIFGLVCIAVTIAGQALSWGGGVKEAWLNENSRSDALRALVYLRYLYAYFPPVLMVILAYMCKHPSVCRKLFYWSILCTVIFMLIWICDIVPFIQNERGLVPKAWSFTRFTDIEITIKSYYTVILVVLPCILLMLLLYSQEKIKIMMAAYSVFFLYYYFFNAFEADGATARHNYSYADATYEIVQELQDYPIECPVYVRPESIPRSGQGRLYEIQFMNMRVKLQRGLPDEECSEAIYMTIAPEKDKQLLEQGYLLYKLDDNEYAYIRGEDIEKYMEVTGRIGSNVQ